MAESLPPPAGRDATRRLDDWAQRRPHPQLGRCLFTFAVIADTHVDREGLPSSSPFPVNALANARTRYCVEDIARLGEELDTLAPRFVIHLGDLIHPVPSMPSYAAAAKDFFSIVGRLDIPLYLIPGNHDVGDKPVDWAPAGVVRDEFLAKWDLHFGAQYQAFDEGDCRFILLNAQIINSGLEAEHAQRAWLEDELQASAGRRRFLCLHYPPFLTFRDEPGNYDNLDEPGRSWILGLMDRHRIEVLFTGHVHHFWFNRHGDTDWYLLPSTSFTRQDYSEMFRDAPSEAMQSGRNDVDKVGYYIVCVHAHGHVCHLRRTGGAVLASGGSLDRRPARLAPYHSRESVLPGLGFELRHPWAEVTEIAPSGALDEFHRKRVRNDYPLMALWDMGVRALRVPLQDLETPAVAERMGALTRHGQVFTIISQGMPSEQDRQRLIANQAVIGAWEVSLRMDRVADAIPVVQEVASKVCFPVRLSKLRLKEDVTRDGQPYFHLISHGFVTDDAAEIARLREVLGFDSAFAGVAFRVGRDEHPWQRITDFDSMARELGMAASVTVFMADPNPALTQCDDLANANRIAEALLAAACSRCEVFVDTFMDLDRGHSVRNGVVDRCCNPRLGYYVTRHLHAVIQGLGETLIAGESSESESGRWLTARTGRAAIALHLPHGGAANASGFEDCVELDNGTLRAIDLCDGTITALDATGIVPWLNEDQAAPVLLVID